MTAVLPSLVILMSWVIFVLRSVDDWSVSEGCWRTSMISRIAVSSSREGNGRQLK